jgi:hypothetical protein
MGKESKIPFYEFEAGDFSFQIDENRNSYLSLHDLISDTDLLTAYFQKKDAELEEVSTDVKRKFLNLGARSVSFLFRLKGIQDATIIFNRQTLVVLATIIESMLTEFSSCLFCKFPERMYDYILLDEEGKTKGKVDIKEIIDSPSREQLLLTLASRAASKVMQGEFKFAVKRLEKVIGKKFPTELSEPIIQISENRNKIVHELNDIEVTFDDITKAFDKTFELVEYLENCAIEMKIPVSEISPGKAKL